MQFVSATFSVALAGIVCVAALTACNSKGTLPEVTGFRQGTGDATSNNSKLPNQQSQAGLQFGDGRASGTSVTSIEGEKIDAPTVEFAGQGMMEHRGGEANLQQAFIAEIDDKELRIHVTRFQAVSGDNVSDVNKGLKDSTGISKSFRPLRAELEGLAQFGSFKNLDFLVFATETIDAKGRKFVYVDPVPVLVIPAPEARYQVLQSEAISYQTQVRGAREFTLMTTVRRDYNQPSGTNVVIEYTIPEDRDGDLYGIFPFAKSSTYVIDTTAKRVTEIKTSTLYHDSDRDRARTIDLNFSLCRETRTTGSQVFGNCI